MSVPGDSGSEPATATTGGAPPIPMEILWMVVGGAALTFLFGAAIESPLFVFVGGAALVLALALGAALGEGLQPEVRILLGVLAGILAIAGSYGFFMWYTVITTCGAAIALPAIGTLGGFLGFRTLLMRRWGVTG